MLSAITQGVSSWDLDLGDCEGRTPLLFEDVEADAAIAVDVWVVHLGLEVDLSRSPTVSVFKACLADSKAWPAAGMQFLAARRPRARSNFTYLWGLEWVICGQHFLSAEGESWQLDTAMSCTPALQEGAPGGK